MFYLTTHSTHFIYGYMASDIWLRTILIVRKETRCHHMGYSFRLTSRVLLYAPSHRQDNKYHGLCYTSRGALAGTRNSSMVFMKKYEVLEHDSIEISSLVLVSVLWGRFTSLLVEYFIHIPASKSMFKLELAKLWLVVFLLLFF